MELIRLLDLETMPWQPHPTIAGIQTKVIQNGAADRLADVLLAKVLPGGQISWHVHENASETAYLVQGQGTLLYCADESQRNTPSEAVLVPGSALKVEAGVQHCVLNTGDEPLILFAFHTPPTF